jgi:tetratricopeptide (TPR) repeat protein
MDVVVPIEDGGLRARVLSVYGLAMARAGRPHQALSYLLESTGRYHDLGRPAPVAICLSNAAEIAFDLGWYEEALAMLRRSIAVLRQADVPFRRSGVLDWLAKIHLRLGRPRTAIRYATASLTLSEQEHHTAQRVHTLHWRSLAWLEAADPGRAVADAQTALDAACADGGLELELAALRHLAAVYWLAGDDRATRTLALADVLAEQAAGERAGAAPGGANGAAAGALPEPAGGQLP